MTTASRWSDIFTGFLFGCLFITLITVFGADVWVATKPDAAPAMSNYDSLAAPPEAYALESKVVLSAEEMDLVLFTAKRVQELR